MFNFIKAENPEGAKRVIKALVSLGNSLSTLPHRFPLDPILIAEPIPFRFAVKGNYKIIYTIEEDNVMVVEVFDTRRDPNRLME